MLVVFFCVMMKILEFSSGRVIVNKNMRNNNRNKNINDKNDIKSRQCLKRCRRGKRHSIVNLFLHVILVQFKLLNLCSWHSYVIFIAVDWLLKHLGHVGVLVRKIFGQKNEETEESGTLNNEELGCSYTTRAIVKIAGHGSRIRESRCAICMSFGYWMGKGKDHINTE